MCLSIILSASTLCCLLTLAFVYIDNNNYNSDNNIITIVNVYDKSINNINGHVNTTKPQLSQSQPHTRIFRRTCATLTHAHRGTLPLYIPKLVCLQFCKSRDFFFHSLVTLTVTCLTMLRNCNEYCIISTITPF